MAYIWHPLFFIGNKRSGTSHFVQLLNLSTKVYVCPEADLLWLLYQVEHSTMPQPCAWDGDRAMRATVRTCNDILFSNLPVRDRFYKSAVRIRSRSEGWRCESLPTLIGDKKPVQYADPTLRPFIYKHFPDAKCIHLIRHPGAVVSSMIQQAYGSMPWMNCWKVKPGVLVESWCRHESWVREIKAIELYQELRGKIMVANPDPEGDLLNAAHISRLDASLAALLRRLGRTSDAVSLDENRLKLCQHWDSKLPGNPFVQRQLAAKSVF